jgi:hypothetical protein
MKIAISHYFAVKLLDALLCKFLAHLKFLMKFCNFVIFSSSDIIFKFGFGKVLWAPFLFFLHMVKSFLSSMSSKTNYTDAHGSIV